MPETANSKYELLLDEFVEILGMKLFRIRAKIACGIVREGEKGGYIESEKNLSVSGDAWVSGDARVFGNAWVSGDAQVFGNARVFGDARVSGDAQVEKSQDLLVMGPVGSRNDYLTVWVRSSMATTGCFTGTLDELEAAAKKNGRQDYLDLLPAIRAIVERRKEVRD